VVSLCEHTNDSPLGGVKLIGQRLNSGGSPVTLADAAAAKASDMDTTSIAASRMLKGNNCTLKPGQADSAVDSLRTPLQMRDLGLRLNFAADSIFSSISCLRKANSRPGRFGEFH